MTSPHFALQVGIVGGGIADVALALDLCRHPHLQVTLFEAAPAFGEVGAGVSFGADAVHAIEGLRIGKLYELIADRTAQPLQEPPTPCFPHQGAGAGQGLEDAWLFARLLGDPRVLHGDAQRVLQVYDAI